jgi:hypothetical protein
MFFKVNYPLEFFASSLTFCADDKKDDLIQDAMKNGVDVRPPKIGKSSFEKWAIVDGRLYCPFCEIRGIGPKTAEALRQFGIESRQDVKKHLPRFAAIFEECRCYDDEKINDEFAEEIGKYFSFSFCRNAAVKFKRIESIIKEQPDYDTAVSGIVNQSCTYFGYIEDMKMTHDKEAGGVNIRASLRDMTGSNTVFFGEVRKSKKEKTEHIAEKIVVARGMKSGRGSISCFDLWDEEDIVSARLQGLQINFIEGCSVIVLTESPRKARDDGFDFIEKRLRHNFRDVGADYYDITFLSLFNSEGSANAKIDSMIDAGKPIIIFGLGAKVLQHLQKEKLSISDLNGTTIWDKARQCWISFGISQASIFYNADSNGKLLEQAVDNFAESLKNISGLR